MGGRGSHSLGLNPEMQYQTVGFFHDVKILQKINAKDSVNLPLDAKSSSAYILLDDNGTFRMYREYDKNHRLKFEIAYHKEKFLDPSRKPIVHAHDITYTKEKFEHEPARRLTPAEIKKYHELIKGLNV